MTESVVRSPWLPFGVAQDTEIRLLLLPHAGAGATVFRAWSSGLPSFIGACPVQPPGREKRRREPSLRSADAIVALLAPEVMSAVKPPYALFGHSTGALCAFELARQIRRLGGPTPAHLFVSGRRAPQLPMARTPIGGLSPEELSAVLGRLGGTPEQVLAEPAMLAMIQPLLAADFAVNEDYSYHPESPLDLPNTAFAGSADGTATPEQMTGWAEQTSGEFNAVTLSGGHFSIFDQSRTVLDHVSCTLRNLV